MNGARETNDARAKPARAKPWRVAALCTKIRLEIDTASIVRY
jgi:hypothetical protein